MSDTDSRIESFRSAVDSDSPLHSDDLDNTPAANWLPPFPPLPLPPVALSNQLVRDAAAAGRVNKGFFGGGGVGGERRERILRRRDRREVMVRRAELGIRVWEVIVCVISFSVMLSDKTQGWSGDSYYRYKEYRYCLAVTLIAFVYSGFQACDLAYDLITGNRVIFHHHRYYFNFAMDQVLAYLLISASSAAATRIDDWVSNWGQDVFTDMASASVGMSFLAFAALALSSLISGCNVINHSGTTITTTAA